MGKEILGCPPLSIQSKVAVVLEEWAPPQEWEEVDVMPGAVVEALHKSDKSLKKQDAHLSEGAICWLFPPVLKRP